MSVAPNLDGEDRSYKGKLAEGVLEAIIKASLTESTDGTRTAFIDSAAVVDVFLKQMAVIVSTSEVCSTPRGKREFCDQIARKLQRLISSAQVDPEVRELFTTMHVSGMH